MTTSRQPITLTDPVGRIMRGPVVATVPEEASLREIAQELVADEIGAVLVNTAHGIAGVISERDLVTVFGAGGDLENQQATDVMNPDVVWVNPGETIRDAARLMNSAQIRHLPVRDDNGVVLGVVSIRDVLRVLIDTSSDHDTPDHELRSRTR